MSFSFAFSGDDIEGDDAGHASKAAGPLPTASAFPVQGKPQLPPQRHALRDMLARLPSKIAYGLLDVALDGASEQEAASSAEGPATLRLPRRELWDVRVQLMAEDEGSGDGSGDSHGDSQPASGDLRAGDLHELAPGLGSHDVKTGIYEGGFKSWESSVDLVKVLLQPSPTSSFARPSATAADILLQGRSVHVIELGCGTALPSLALFQWACATIAGGEEEAGSGAPPSLSITVADYNPSVLYLVTLPNFLLAWALQQQHANPILQQALSVEENDGSGPEGGELELTDEVKDAFCAFLDKSGITLSFLSGGWSPAFTDLLHDGTGTGTTDAITNTLVLGAETIYSPFALETFSETLLTIFRRQLDHSSTSAKAIVGAKKLYFGVGGSLDDFVRRMRDSGAAVDELREEAEGVRRGVVQCRLEKKGA